MDRRSFLVGSAAAALVPASSVKAGPAGLIPFLDAFVQRALEQSPQLLTATGLDTGPNARARFLLDDRSSVATARLKSLFEELSRDLTKFGAPQPGGRDWIDYESASYLAKVTLRGFEFPYGDPNVGTAIPYIVSQLTGAYRNVPSFLANQHPVKTTDDAEAYLSRLSAFAPALDQETARLRADIAAGASPPRFIIRTALSQFAALMSGGAENSELVRSLVARTGAAQVAGDWATRATEIVRREVVPALRRQSDTLTQALPVAPEAAGVWRLPDGEKYYAYAISAATTKDLTADEIHNLGLQLVADLTNRADKLLRGLGYGSGSVSARLRAIRSSDAQRYTDDEAGRADLLRDLTRLSHRIEAVLPSFFGSLPGAPVNIVRMSPSIEAGASGATYQPPSLQGGRPGIFAINLRKMDEWPKLDLPTLVHHEALPGHHLQNALMIEADGIPMLRRLPIYSGYSEGWALYAEQLADEMGVFENDALGRVGYLASMLFRAVRLVVDTGIHSKRWTVETAARYMSNTLGDAQSSVRREVERYCVQPGQALSYAVGWKSWTTTREMARERLSNRFDIQRFHDRALLAGNMPLEVLEKMMGDWA